ncbi:hypothetical protein CALCODRAFT_486417 [Calocera cornea HHB12733]|uniref:Uncharacterized protein n=1 Tax=Calocera cornea HHB12733 TaxID=1353952 RepID=A0A165DQV7_9BASI|nr:hypothetical protein CALCODRAFT_486417 [Calocera cornea HHB12733]
MPTRMKSGPPVVHERGRQTGNAALEDQRGEPATTHLASSDLGEQAAAALLLDAENVDDEEPLPSPNTVRFEILPKKTGHNHSDLPTASNIDDEEPLPSPNTVRFEILPKKTGHNHSDLPTASNEDMPMRAEVAKLPSTEAGSSSRPVLGDMNQSGAPEASKGPPRRGHHPETQSEKKKANRKARHVEEVDLTADLDLTLGNKDETEDGPPARGQQQKRAGRNGRRGATRSSIKEVLNVPRIRQRHGSSEGSEEEEDEQPMEGEEEAAKRVSELPPEREKEGDSTDEEQDDDPMDGEGETRNPESQASSEDEETGPKKANGGQAYYHPLEYPERNAPELDGYYNGKTFKQRATPALRTVKSRTKLRHWTEADDLNCGSRVIPVEIAYAELKAEDLRRIGSMLVTHPGEVLTVEVDMGEGEDRSRWYLVRHPRNNNLEMVEGRLEGEDEGKEEGGEPASGARIANTSKAAEGEQDGGLRMQAVGEEIGSAEDWGDANNPTDHGWALSNGDDDNDLIDVSSADEVLIPLEDMATASRTDTG